MKIENLILVHSFPTNSLLLRDLIEYLGDYFENVHCIDLPGFTRAIPPLETISFDGYRQFVQNKINELNLDSYWMAGLSFGFFIIDRLKHDGRCKSIIAMEPYLGAQSLQKPTRKEELIRGLVHLILKLNWSDALWRNPLFRRLFPALADSIPAKSVDIVLNEIDGRTFFETADLLLNNKERAVFQNLPDVLVINKDDETLNYEYVYRTFREHTRRLFVIHTAVEHHPRNPSKAYFQERIPADGNLNAIQFVRGQTRPLGGD